MGGGVRHRADDIGAALATVGGAHFTIRLSAAGVFDQRGRIDALWAGVTPHDELRAPHKNIDRACQSAGTAPDQRAYLPHTTLARINRAPGPVTDHLSLHAGLSSETFVLDQFVFFATTLDRQRAGSHRDAAHRQA